jgi:hypothetical protein
MKKPKIYDNYPLWIVILANILMLAVYVAGAYIMFVLSIITGFLYVAYLVLLELYFLKKGVFIVVITANYVPLVKEP